MDRTLNYGSMFLFDGLCQLADIYVVWPPTHTWPYHTSPLPPYTLLSQQSSLKMKFDFIVVSNTHDEVIRVAQRFKSLSAPFIVYFNSDDIAVDEKILDMFNPPCYFLREYHYNSTYPNNCYPLPFSSPFPITKVDDIDRPIEIFFVMSNNNPARKTWYNILINNFINTNSLLKLHDNRSLLTAEYIPTDKYFELLRQSKVCVNLRGFGNETVRFYEGISQGAVMTTDQNLLVRPNPFIYGRHVYYTEESRLHHHLALTLNNYEKHKEMVVKAQSHLLKYHTTVARAEGFLSTIKEYLI